MVEPAGDLSGLSGGGEASEVGMMLEKQRKIKREMCKEHEHTYIWNFRIAITSKCLLLAFGLALGYAFRGADRLSYHGILHDDDDDDDDVVVVVVVVA